MSAKQHLPKFKNPTGNGAIFSKCEKYRYVLWRSWSNDAPACVFIGLNPSTADAEHDDPTIRRCRNFAHGWGYGSLIMLNLFAWKDTSPENLKRRRRPIGPENDFYLQDITSTAGLVVVAWGNHGTHRNRHEQMYSLLKGVDTKCFKITGMGQPIHPLYQRTDAKLIRFASSTD